MYTQIETSPHDSSGSPNQKQGYSFYKFKSKSMQVVRQLITYLFEHDTYQNILRSLQRNSISRLSHAYDPLQYQVCSELFDLKHCLDFISTFGLNHILWGLHPGFVSRSCDSVWSDPKICIERQEVLLLHSGSRAQLDLWTSAGLKFENF